MKIAFTEEAAEHADAADRWWRQNRPAAPSLFREELLDALRVIEGSPSVGSVFKKQYRRVRLLKTRNHVYYQVDEQQGVITVVAVWGMPKRRGPKL